MRWFILLSFLLLTACAQEPQQRMEIQQDTPQKPFCGDFHCEYSRFTLLQEQALTYPYLDEPHTFLLKEITSHDSIELCVDSLCRRLSRRTAQEIGELVVSLEKITFQGEEKSATVVIGENAYTCTQDCQGKTGYCGDGLCQSTTLSLEEEDSQDVIVDGLPVQVNVLSLKDYAYIIEIHFFDWVQRIQGSGTTEGNLFLFLEKSQIPFLYRVEPQEGKVLLSLGEEVSCSDCQKDSLTQSFVSEERILPTPFQEATISKEEDEKEIQSFLTWAEGRNIQIVGVNRTTNDFYYNGSSETDFLDPRPVPHLLVAAKGLYKLPDNILKVMEGKAIYASYREGRGYTILSTSDTVLNGLNRGFFLEQPITEEQTIHEFGHILDYHGIRGAYDDPEDRFSHLDALRERVFKVEQNTSRYVDDYAKSNEAENFAQHFMSYVLYGEHFRELAAQDADLKAKYDFFKEYIFEGKEY